MPATLDQVIENLDSLSLEDKEYVRNIFDKMIAEDFRKNILKDSEKAEADYRAGKLKAYDSIEAMRRDLDESYSE